MPTSSVRTANNKKGCHLDSLSRICGRGGGIRTRDPLHPMQVRYQAALRPDSRTVILHDFF